MVYIDSNTSVFTVAIVGGGAVVGLDSQTFSSECSTRIVRGDGQQVEQWWGQWRRDTLHRFGGAQRLKPSSWEGDK
jgi:hypothetical protein